MSATVEQLIADFKTFYGATAATPSIYSFAPGRLNFIGEHVDYLGGSVVPAAIDFGCTVLMSVEKKNAGESSSTSSAIDFSFISKEIDTEKGAVSFSLPADEGTLVKGKSLRTILMGAMIEAQKLIKELSGGDIINSSSSNSYTVKGLISSTIPIGAGLSSSAALCVALIQGLTYALLPAEASAKIFANGDGADAVFVKACKNKLARSAQAVENAHCGTNCGIMDQYASIFGKADTILEVDCGAMSHTAVPLFPPAVGGYQVFLINSMRAHDLGSNYNEVRADLSSAEEKINAYLKSAAAAAADSFVAFKQMAGQTFLAEKLSATQLIDALSADGSSAAAALLTASPKPAESMLLNKREHGRASYAVSEMERVVAFNTTAGSSSEAVASGAATPEAILTVLGDLLYKTHDGLANQLLVSTVEIDKIVSICRGEIAVRGGVYGARIMGGGFGGCVLALVKKSEAAAVEEVIQSQFAAAFPELGPCAVYKVALVDGASVKAIA